MNLGAFQERAAPSAPPTRISDLNTRFLEHLRVSNADPVRIAAAAAQLQAGEVTPESFVPDALALIDPRFAAALSAFDRDEFTAATAAFAALCDDPDPFVAANATYFHARALIERGLLEEAEAALATATSDRVAQLQNTPYAPHVWFLRAYAQAGNLRYEAADEALARIITDYVDAPEPVLLGTRQMRLEFERRERGTLDEVSTTMAYAAARLDVADPHERVPQRQAEAVALLDKLIKDAEQQEQQQRQNSSGRNSRNQQGKGKSQGQGEGLGNPKDVSEVQSGKGRIGDLHGVDKADPGQVWGKLPAAERERILQSLRNRFPSRYRELVEQYYRSLAEEK